MTQVVTSAFEAEYARRLRAIVSRKARHVPDDAQMDVEVEAYDDEAPVVEVRIRANTADGTRFIAMVEYEGATGYERFMADLFAVPEG